MLAAGLRRSGVRPRKQRPAAGDAAARRLRRPSAGCADDGPQAAEAVGGDEAGGDEIAERGPDRRFVQAAGRASGRRRTRRRACGAHRARARPSSRHRASASQALVGVIVLLVAQSFRAAHASACSRRNSAIGVAPTIWVASRAGRGQPRPADLAGQAQRVEHRRLVAVDAVGQDARSQASAASSKPSSDVEDGAQSVEAGQAARRRDVLPREQEAHEVGRADRLDLGAQAVQRVAMDPRQQPAVAPFR